MQPKEPLAPPGKYENSRHQRGKGRQGTGTKGRRVLNETHGISTSSSRRDLTPGVDPMQSVRKTLLRRSSTAPPRDILPIAGFGSNHMFVV